MRIAYGALVLTTALALLPAAQAQTEVSGTITENTTWTLAESPYIANSVTVAEGATLTVEAGAVVKLDRRTLFVQGTLDVAGTAAQPVVFTSIRDDSVGGDTNGDGDASVPGPGNWESVDFEPGSGGTLTHVAFRYGGHYGYNHPVDPIISIEGASPSFSNCEVAHSARYGVRVNGIAAPTFDGCNIRDTSDYGLYVVDGATATVTNSAFADNGTSAAYFVLSDGTAAPVLAGNTGTGGLTIAGVLATDMVWPGQSIPYVAENLTVAEGATLTVEAGAVVKLDRRTLFVQGTLDVAGTAAQPVVFTSIRDDSVGGDTNGDGDASVPGPGNWESVDFEPGSGGTLTHVAFRYGGHYGYNHPVDPIISIEGASPSFSNCEVAHSARYGVRVNGIAAPTFDGCNIRDTSDYGLYVVDGATATVTNSAFADNGTSAAYFVLSDGTAAPVLAGNTGTGGLTIAGVLATDMVWPGQSIPYVAENLTVAEGATLTVEAGAVVKLDRRTLFVQGTLDVAGTAAQPVVFTSIRDDSVGGDTNGDGDASVPGPGNWESVDFEPGSGGTLTHVAFRYGGHYGYNHPVDPIISIEGASPSFSNCEVAHSARYGVRVNGIAAPTFDGCNIRDNLDYGLLNNGDALVDADNNYWGAPSGPFHPTTNPDGQGNRVSDNVDYRPFRTTPVIFNTAPTVAITSGPSGTITSPTATFTWEGSDSNGSIVGYEWTLNEQPGTTTATSRTFSGLGSGSYTFRVRAQDNDGGYSYWASRRFTVTSQTQVPQLSLSTASLALGQSVQISGSGYTPGGEVALFIGGPSEFVPVVQTLTASAGGSFTNTFSTTAEMPPGLYGALARDLVTTQFSNVRAFRLQPGALPPPPALTLLSPDATTTASSSQPVQVVWTDFVRSGSPYPAATGAYRFYVYNLDYSVDGGPWQTAPTAAQDYAPLNQTSTFTHTLTLPAGSVRVRVTDGYAMDRSVVSAPFTVRDATVNAATVALRWDYSYPAPSQPPVGVAADGVARLYLRVAPSAGVQISRVDVALGQSGSLDVGRVMAATVTNTYDNEATSGATGTMAFATTPIDGAFWFWYVAPTSSEAPREASAP